MACTVEYVLKTYYLSGAKEEDLQNVYGECEEYSRTLEQLRESNEVKKIRELCKLRNVCLFENQTIDNYVLSIEKPFEKQDCFNDIDWRFLYDIGWRRNSTNSREIFLSVNEELSKYIETIKNMFPNWIDSTYIKDLFIVKGLGGKQKDINKKLSAIFNNYFSHIHVRKMKVFINFENKISNSEKYYFNDKLFLEALYTSYGKKFDYLPYVKKDMYQKSKIETFLDGADNINVYVDCENVENDNVLSVIESVINSGMKQKINRIILVSDEQATNAWEYLKNYCESRLGLNIDFVLVERTANEKSLVDNEIELSILEDYYENKIKNFILVSSDSDYKAVLKKTKTKDVNIFFCIERKEQKASNRYVEELVDVNASFCSIDDFNKEVCLDFWEYVFRKDFQEYIDKINSYLLENSSNAFVDMFFEEFKYNNIKNNTVLKNFINKQFKNLTLEYEDGQLKIKR